MKIVTAAEMRAAEEAVIAAGTSVEVLMDRAGAALAAVAAEVATLSTGGAIADCGGKRVVVLVGKGKNGGDGLVAARRLADAGATVTIGVAGERDRDPLLTVLADSATILRLPTQLDAFKAAARTADVTIDALLGTGRARAIRGSAADALDALVPPIVAADLPSGLDADSGSVDPHTPTATVTVTFGAPKRGLYLFPGADRVGRVVVADLGIPTEDSALERIDDDLAAKLLPPRPANGHKGTFGKVLIVAGSERYTGAPVLAALSAIRTGAGLVTIATPRPVYEVIAGRVVEPTWLPLDDEGGSIAVSAVDAVLEAAVDYDSVVIGPGLGKTAAPFVRAILPRLRLPLVIDADALNALAPLDTPLPANAVLTPHSGELARLRGGSIPDIEGDRLDVAKAFARHHQTVLVLKGAHTIVSAADGRQRLSQWANPALGTGGTGDVLAGITGALLATGMNPFDAATLGVALHGRAAALWSNEHGDGGLLATDLVNLVPDARHGLRRASAPWSRPSTSR